MLDDPSREPPPSPPEWDEEPRTEAERILARAMDEAGGATQTDEDRPGLDIEELCARHPDEAADLRRLHAQWARFEGLLGGVAPTSAPSRPSTLGPYRVLRTIGSGGQGAVYLAEDTRLDRRVVLKVLLTTMDRGEGLARFRREAEIIAALEHPSIARILDTDLECSTPWLAMPYLEGRSLADALEDRRREEPCPLPLRPTDRVDLVRCLVYFERVARALHAAHVAGVVHRDVKPGNLLVLPDGEPLVLDFGLARLDDRSLELTRAGEVFGTPAYMSPEQWSGERVDARSDVYSLGITLFEVLTLQRPHRGKSQLELQREVLLGNTPRPSRLHPFLDTDVDVVLACAIDRDPERRYATALDFADDLRRIREYEPVRARPAGSLLRLRRWTQRQPRVAGALASTFLALAAGLLVALSFLGETRQALAETHGLLAARRAVELIEYDSAAALALALEGCELTPREATRSALLTTLESCFLERELVRGKEAVGAPLDVALEPGGPHIAVVPRSGEVVLWRIDDGSEVLRVESTGARRAALGEGAETLALVRENGDLECWELDLVSSLAHLRWTAAGAELGTTSLRVLDRGTRFLWETESGVSLLDGATGDVLLQLDSVRFLGDALVAGEGIVHELDTESARIVRSWEAPQREIVDARVMAEDLVAVTSDGFLVHGVPGARLEDFQHIDGDWSSLRLDPSGRRLAVAGTGDDQAPQLLLHDLESARTMSLEGHLAPIHHIAFDPLGERLCSSSRDGTVRIWNTGNGRELRVLTAIGSPRRSDWTSDGRRLVTRDSASARVRVWRTGEVPFTYAPQRHGPVVRHLAFSPDGGRLFGVNDEGNLLEWATPAGLELEAEHDPGHLLSRSPTLSSWVRFGENHVLTFGGARAELWETSPDLRCVYRTTVQESLRTGTLLETPAGPGLALLAADDTLHLIDPEGTTVLDVPADMRHIEASETTGLLALAGGSDTVTVLAWPDGAVVSKIELETRRPGVVDLVWHPSGEELFLACHDYTLRFLDARTGQPTRPAAWTEGAEDLRQTFAMSDVGIDARGRYLHVRGPVGGKAMILVDLVHGLSWQPAHAHLGPVVDFQLHADSAISASRDGDVIVWDIPADWPRSGARGEPRIRRHHGAALTALAIAPDGRIASADASGAVFVWPEDPRPAAELRKPRDLSDSDRRRERTLGVLPDSR